MLRYSVYRGPGSRIVAISKEPRNRAWTIKSGEQGKKLRIATVPVSECPDFDSLKAAHVTAGYAWLFDGHIDAFGASTELDSSAVSWEARDVDIEQARDLLRGYASDLQSAGLVFDFVDDMSGTRLRIGQTTFGISRSPRPDCINYADGYGAGKLFPASSADLLCLIAILSQTLPIRMADAEGKPLSRGKVIDQCAYGVSAGMAALLSKCGSQSLMVTLRSNNVRRLGF
jgi:hypothetical protein